MIHSIPIVCVVGESGAGKTTLIEKLLREFEKRNYVVGTIKHTHSFEIDKPGKDTWRHAQAGARTVIISGYDKIAMIKKVEQEWELEQLLKLSPEVDLFIVEGFKHSNQPKIEVFRHGHCMKLLSKVEQLLAVASDVQLFVPGVPVLDINDAVGLANLIEEKIIKRINKK